jgi:hypothetical protein
VSKPTSSSADATQIGNLANQMAATGATETAEGSTLFNLALPGLTSAESYYGKLATGDPAALARANAPAIQSITQATNSAKSNIVQDNPRGGERNLALEEADLSKGAQIGNLETGSYTSSFGSLAGLGGQNVSQGTQATATGLQGMQGAANQYSNLLNINAESKASTLGFAGSLAGAAGEAAAGFCWVARELFGDGSYEYRLIRAYFTDVLANHWFGKWAYDAYFMFGERWAEYIKTHMVWREITLRVFTRLFYLAQKSLPEKRRRDLFDLYWANRKGPSLWRVAE